MTNNNYNVKTTYKITHLAIAYIHQKITMTNSNIKIIYYAIINKYKMKVINNIIK